jgi:hypothetical protein
VFVDQESIEFESHYDTDAETPFKSDEYQVARQLERAIKSFANQFGLAGLNAANPTDEAMTFIFKRVDLIDVLSHSHPSGRAAYQRLFLDSRSH